MRILLIVALTFVAVYQTLEVEVWKERTFESLALGRMCWDLAELSESVDKLNQQFDIDDLSRR